MFIHPNFNRHGSYELEDIEGTIIDTFRNIELCSPLQYEDFCTSQFRFRCMPNQCIKSLKSLKSQRSLQCLSFLVESLRRMGTTECQTIINLFTLATYFFVEMNNTKALGQLLLHFQLTPAIDDFIYVIISSNLLPKMFSDDYRYYLWKTIHIFVYIVQQIIKSYYGIKANIQYYFNKNVDTCKKQIDECKQSCDKIPKHIILILGEKQVDYFSLSNIITWATIADIKCVSIYDYTGEKEHISLYICIRNDAIDSRIRCYHQSCEFFDKRERFLKHLEEANNLFYDSSSKNLSYGSITYRNGVRHSMSLNILDPRHSKFQMSQLCRHIARIGDTADHLNINYIEKIINTSESHISDPELGLYFDDVCCTFGLLPWQIRLTEFIPLKFHSTINVTQFLDTLYRYAKCEQRFGK